jgi:hypothetical protein
MKKFLIPIMIIAFGVAFYEQSKEKSNLYILIIAIVIFMYGMLRLSAKTPSKEDDNLDEDDSERR